MVTGPKPRTIEEIIVVLRLNSIEDKGCLLWQGRTAGDGYGVISWRGRQVYIHRLIYDYNNDDAALVVRHTCDKPNCWEYTHLVNGTHADNVNDKVLKKRHTFGEIHPASRLTEAQARIIKTSTLPNEVLAAQFDVTRGAIHGIRSGRTWKHI